jgi:hypothetical protein
MDLNEVPAAPFRRHPWEVARARFFGKVVVEAIPAGAPARVLDIGAGDGYLARSLLGGIPVGSSVACVDSNYTDAELQRFASPPTAGLTFSRTRPAGHFDVILLLDVIEHIADDRAFLDELIGGSLDRNGLVVVSVPAWDLLYGQHDLALKHFRRYQPAQCRALLEATGLEIVHDGGLFHSLLLPRVLQRIAEAAGGALRVGRGGRGADRPANLGEWRGGQLLSSLVTLALEADTRLSTRLARGGRAVPGLSYFALCRKGAA